MKQEGLKNMSLKNAECQDIKTNSTTFWHFWSFKIPQHGLKLLILYRKSLKNWKIYGRYLKISSQYFWRKTTLKIEMGPKYKKFLDSSTGTVSINFFPPLILKNKRHFEFDLGWKHQACSYGERSLNVEIHQYWEPFSILGLSGFRRKE